MFCEICKKKITKRKHIYNLFLRETHHICEFCYKKYPLIYKQSIMPLDGGEIVWSSLIQTFDEVSPLAHMSFYKPFYIEFLKHYNDHILIIFDMLSDEKIVMLEKVKLGDIYLLTLYDIIEKKENNYEI